MADIEVRGPIAVRERLDALKAKLRPVALCCLAGAALWAVAALVL